MVTSLAQEFATRVFERADARRIIRASATDQSQIETGHPSFADLAVGERRSCEMVSLFLDLTDFTGRTFWDGAEETADLAHGALSGFSYVVEAFGGHVLGLRGDGVFAGFGPSADPRIAAAAALTACAAALDAIEAAVNPPLLASGREPIQARAGLDYGETTFIRSGTKNASEVNVIGFATNFAAKCEKKAHSWEVIAGEGLHDVLGPAGLLTKHADSPKRYQRAYQVKSYNFFDCAWRRLLPQVESTMTEIAGRSLVGASF
jgi:adenylate cyclase